jgi:hypothetical protein
VGNKALRVLRVDMSMASEQLRFPPGHPHEGVVYVGDPVRKDVYYPAADFHRKAFERKFSDAVHLLMALGAIKIEVVYREGWGRDFAGRLEVASLLGRGKSAGSKRSDQESQILFAAELDPSDPVVPEGLAWLDYEPNWQGVVNGRKQYGLRNFSLILSYRDSFRIDSEFESKIKAVGLDAGGKVEEFKATRWDIEGEFAPVGATANRGAASA